MPVSLLPRLARALAMPIEALIADDGPPGSWYLPFSGRLRLAVATPHPIEVDLVVNLTPSERLSGSTGALDRNLSFLLPIFKVLSQVEWRNAAFNIALLDLARRRVAFHQE